MKRFIVVVLLFGCLGIVRADPDPFDEQGAADYWHQQATQTPEEHAESDGAYSAQVAADAYARGQQKDTVDIFLEQNAEKSNDDFEKTLDKMENEK
jgi:hypothetical protein